jgi:hypothetical protein
MKLELVAVVSAGLVRSTVEFRSVMAILTVQCYLVLVFRFSKGDCITLL